MIPPVLDVGMKSQGAPSVTYLLRADASAALDQTFTDGQVLNTPAVGIFAGSMTVVSVSSPRVSIASGRFSFTGNNTWTQTGLLGTADLPDAVGRVWKLRADVYATSTTFGIHGYRQSASLNLMQEGVWGSGLSRFYNHNGAQTQVGFFPSTGTYDMAMISKGGRTGFKFLTKKVGAPSWDHFATSVAAATAFIPAVSAFRGTHSIDYIKVTETLFPDMVSGSDYSDLDLI
jgi:hypothetical protein